MSSRSIPPTEGADLSLRISRSPLRTPAAIRELEQPGLGAVVVFAGRVRPDVRRGERVTALDYEVHRGPALRILQELDETARRRFGVAATVLWHRVGRVRVGEVSVIVGAAAAHRPAAFNATRFLIDRLKETVPIWKTERARVAARPPRSSHRPPRRRQD